MQACPHQLPSIRSLHSSVAQCISQQESLTLVTIAFVKGSSNNAGNCGAAAQGKPARGRSSFPIGRNTRRMGAVIPRLGAASRSGKTVSASIRKTCVSAFGRALRPACGLRNLQVSPPYRGHRGAFQDRRPQADGGSLACNRPAPDQLDAGGRSLSGWGRSRRCLWGHHQRRATYPTRQRRQGLSASLIVFRPCWHSRKSGVRCHVQPPLGFGARCPPAKPHRGVRSRVCAACPMVTDTNAAQRRQNLHRVPQAE